MRLRFLGTLITLILATDFAYAGAWGHKSFDNDDALDWVESDLKPRGLKAVERAIARVANGRGFLEAPDACYAIAACEVLSAEQGRPSADLPEEVAAIAKKLPQEKSDSSRETARKALDRILGKDSELRGLWEEAGDHFEKWKASVEDLKSRI